jgi:transposase-like protein
MALSESAVSELLDAFRAGDDVDLIRDAATMVLQELIEVEATEAIGAGRYERADSRVTDRDGSRRVCWRRRPVCRAANPEAAQGQLLRVDPRVSPSYLVWRRVWRARL